MSMDTEPLNYPGHTRLCGCLTCNPEGLDAARWQCTECGSWYVPGEAHLHTPSYVPPDQPQGGDPRFYQLLEEFKELHSRKNTDYSKGGKQGHLGNFIRVSEIKKLYPGLDLSSPLGTAIDYMLKQLDAALILYSTQRESVTGEGIEERLKDVAVYAILGILLRRDETTPVAAPKP